MKEFGAQTAKASSQPPESPMKEFGALKQRDGLLSQADALQMALGPKEYGSYKAFGAQRRSQPVMAPKLRKSDAKKESRKASQEAEKSDESNEDHKEKKAVKATETRPDSSDEGNNTDDDDEGAVSQEVLLAIALQKSKQRQATNSSVATSSRPPKSQSLGPSGTQALADRMNGAVCKISGILASPLPSRNGTLFGKSNSGDSGNEAGGFKAVQRQVPQSPMMRTPVGVKKSILSSSLHGNDSSRAALDPNLNLSAKSEHSPLSNNNDGAAAASSVFDGVADAAHRLSGLLMSPKPAQDHKSNQPPGMPPRSPIKSPRFAASTSKSASMRNVFAESNNSSSNGGSLRNLFSGGTGGSLRNVFSSSSHASTSVSANQINLASMHASEDYDDDDGDSFHDDGEDDEGLKTSFLSSVGDLPFGE